MTKIIGILNVTPDSFSDGNKYFVLDDAIKRVERLIKDGADIIDIGAESTRYNAVSLTHKQEWSRLEPILCGLSKDIRNSISIDTYHPESAQKAIDLGVKYINDVKGAQYNEMLKIIAKNPDIKYIAMYSVVVPANRNIRISSIKEIDIWVQKAIDRCINAGLNKEQIILDPGIGFTTNSTQSLWVLSNIKKYKKYNIPICIGHSRKSFLENIAKIPPSKRDVETLAASSYMYLQQVVDYIRVHNVELHARAFKVLKALIDIKEQ